MTTFIVTDGEHELPIEVVSYRRDEDGGIEAWDVRIGNVPIEPALFLPDWVFNDLDRQVRRYDDDQERMAREFAAEYEATC